MIIEFIQRRFGVVKTVIGKPEIVISLRSF